MTLLDRSRSSTQLRGEKRLNDGAERGIRTWTSQADIARLLLMRRIPMPQPPRARSLEVPRARCHHSHLDYVVAKQEENLPTPAKPILPIHLRPALLVGVAIVERAGPEMLQMLRGYMMALSTYVGHVNVGDTYWYLQAVPELMAIAGDRFEALSGKLGEAHHG